MVALSSARWSGQIPVCDARRFEMETDAIEQRAREATAVTLGHL